MELAIQELMQPTAEAAADLRDIIGETRTAKERFQSCLEAYRTEILPHAKAIGGKKLQVRRLLVEKQNMAPGIDS